MGFSWHPVHRRPGPKASEAPQEQEHGLNVEEGKKNKGEKTLDRWERDFVFEYSI